MAISIHLFSPIYGNKIILFRVYKKVVVRPHFLMFPETKFMNTLHSRSLRPDRNDKSARSGLLSPMQTRFPKKSLVRLFSRSILSSVLIVGLGMATESLLRRDFSAAFAQVEAAQTIAQVQFSEDQVNRYAGAVNAIEKKREEILRRAKNTQEWSAVAQIADSKGVDVCSLNPSEQPAVIQSLCRELIDFSEQEIRKYGFSNNREFNQLTVNQQQDPSLQGRIQGRILQLRGYR
jgi:hypothetical protein